MDLARHYGDAARFRIGPVRFFQFTHPDQVQEVLVKQAKKLHKPTRLKEVFGRWDGQGLLLSEGDLWVRQRRLVQQAFQPRRVRDTPATWSHWPANGIALGRRTEIDIVDEMHRATLDIVCKTLFGFTAADHAGIREAVQDLQDAALVRIRPDRAVARLAAARVEAPHAGGDRLHESSARRDHQPAPRARAKIRAICCRCCCCRSITRETAAA